MRKYRFTENVNTQFGRKKGAYVGSTSEKALDLIFAACRDKNIDLDGIEGFDFDSSVIMLKDFLESGKEEEFVSIWFDNLDQLPIKRGKGGNQ